MTTSIDSLNDFGDFLDQSLAIFSQALQSNPADDAALAQANAKIASLIQAQSDEDTALDARLAAIKSSLSDFVAKVHAATPSDSGAVTPPDSGAVTPPDSSTTGVS